MNMDDLDRLKPDWTNRRKLIKCITYGLAAMLVVSLIASIALAAFAKFGLYISIFLTVYVTLCFMVMLGVIGSYVFGARWENQDFLNVLPGIVPDFNMRGDSPTYEHKHNDDEIPS